MRVGDLEFRQLPERDPEIVRWTPIAGTPTCYTLMFFERDKEGFSSRFVGGRPLEYHGDEKTLWALMRYAQRVLDAAFDLQKETV